MNIDTLDSFLMNLNHTNRFTLTDPSPVIIALEMCDQAK